MNDELLLGFQENQTFFHVLLRTINSFTLHLARWKNIWRTVWEIRELMKCSSKKLHERQKLTLFSTGLSHKGHELEYQGGRQSFHQNQLQVHSKMVWKGFLPEIMTVQVLSQLLLICLYIQIHSKRSLQTRLCNSDSSLGPKDTKLYTIPTSIIWTPFYYREFSWFRRDQNLYNPYLYNMDSYSLRRVLLVQKRPNFIQSLPL